MDETGWTVEQLAARLGKAPWRITERTVLLTLRPEYQDLLASGNLKPSEATELARLSPRGQGVLFNAIRKPPHTAIRHNQLWARTYIPEDVRDGFAGQKLFLAKLGPWPMPEHRTTALAAIQIAEWKQKIDHPSPRHWTSAP